LILFFLFFVLLFGLSFCEINYGLRVRRPSVIVFVFIALCIFVGLKFPGISKDDSSYLVSFESINGFLEYIIDYNSFSFHEPGFHFLVALFKIFFFKNYFLYFFCFAILALLIKFKIFFKYGESFFLPLAIYFSLILPMHEMTQIRIAIGGGIVLYAWFCYSEGKIKQSLLLIFFAILFHYSSLIGLVVFLFNNSRPRLMFYVLIFFMFFLGIVYQFDSKVFVIGLNIKGISDKIAAYKLAEDAGLIFYDKSNIYNIVFISKVALFIVLSFFGRNLPYQSWFHLFMKLFGLSLGAYVLLSADPTISIRISDLLGLPIIFLIASIPFIVEEKYLATFIIFLYCFSILSISLYNDKLFTTYKLFYQT
jgi:hypothetical protein